MGLIKMPDNNPPARRPSSVQFRFHLNREKYPNTVKILIALGPYLRGKFVGEIIEKQLTGHKDLGGNLGNLKDAFPSLMQITDETVQTAHEVETANDFAETATDGTAEKGVDPQYGF
jgi:hypothetical protein